MIVYVNTIFSAKKKCFLNIRMMTHAKNDISSKAEREKNELNNLCLRLFKKGAINSLTANCKMKLAFSPNQTCLG
jgi:hypothetical protein